MDLKQVDKQKWMPMSMAVKEEIHELKRYAINVAKPARKGRYPEPDYFTYELVGTLIDEGLGESFQPFVDAEYTISFEVPATWLDHLKTHLPKDLQFGWLEPRFKTLSKTVTAPVTINVNNYTVVLAHPCDSHYVRCVQDSPKFDVRNYRTLRETTNDQR